MYRTLTAMLRQFSKRAHDLFLQNLVKGTTHLSLGMEAIATGFGAALQEGDYTFATYRGHAHSLARGMDPGAAMAELLGRENGMLGGKGGSMHLTDVVEGHDGLVRDHRRAPVHRERRRVVGADARDRRRSRSRSSATARRTSARSTRRSTSAKVWNLPTVFVCENNLYMEYTPIDAVTAVDHPAADRASAYGLEQIAHRRQRPRRRLPRRRRRRAPRPVPAAGPSLIEAVTYRSGGHSRADPGKYRPAEEVEAWAERDPVPLYRGAAGVARGRGGAARRDRRRGRRRRSTRRPSSRRWAPSPARRR